MAAPWLSITEPRAFVNTAVLAFTAQRQQDAASDALLRLGRASGDSYGRQHRGGRRMQWSCKSPGKQKVFQCYSCYE